MSVRVTKLQNTSEENVTVKHQDGVVSSVPPGGTLENVRITNLEEVQKKVSVTMNLGEIEERGRGQGRTQLRD